ncbi:MAG: hypothetical protein GY953_42635, partial [bacterium]|nr:hypothetical protein [bacterium]
MPTRRTFLATALAPLATAQSATPVVDTHIHLFSPNLERFPFHPNATYRPEPASLADYSAFVAQAGIDHTIIVHPEP